MMKTSFSLLFLKAINVNMIMLLVVAATKEQLPSFESLFRITKTERERAFCLVYFYLE